MADQYEPGKAFEAELERRLAVDCVDALECVARERPGFEFHAAYIESKGMFVLAVEAIPKFDGTIHTEYREFHSGAPYSQLVEQARDAASVAAKKLATDYEKGLSR